MMRKTFDSNRPRPTAGNPAVRGFTLIELLIVIAIITVLAAIAVPQYLQAQTRSKIASAKADMRTMATAVESYFLDHDAYPIPSDIDGGAIPPGRRVEWFETRLPLILTTPVSYISKIPGDVFAANDGEPALLHYANRPYVVATEGNDREFDDLVRIELGIDKRVRFFILSHGPDIDHDFAAIGHPHAGGNEFNPNPEPAIYDPTNGVVSNGDVIYWGPGFGYLEN
jgi:type II secretion system protein G